MMTMTHIPACNYEINGDEITIEQDTNGDGIYGVTIHRMHLEHIASLLGIPVLSGTASEVLRRFETVAEKLDEVLNDEGYRSQIVGCHDGPAMLAELNAVQLLAGEFIDSFAQVKDEHATDTPPHVQKGQIPLLT